MLEKKTIGKPCAGKSHARFDEEGKGVKSLPLLYREKNFYKFNRTWESKKITLPPKKAIEPKLVNIHTTISVDCNQLFMPTTLNRNILITPTCD